MHVHASRMTLIQTSDPGSAPNCPNCGARMRLVRVVLVAVALVTVRLMAMRAVTAARACGRLRPVYLVRVALVHVHGSWRPHDQRDAYEQPFLRPDP